MYPMKAIDGTDVTEETDAPDKSDECNEPNRFGVKGRNRSNRVTINNPCTYHHSNGFLEISEAMFYQFCF